MRVNVIPVSRRVDTRTHKCVKASHLCVNNAFKISHAFSESRYLFNSF